MSLEQIKKQAPVLVVIILATILIIGAIQVGPGSMDFNDRRVGMPGENKMGKPMEKWDDKPKGIIAVNGEGIASDKPNIISIRVDIRGESKSAEEATRIAANNFDRLVDSLSKEGIRKENIVSNNFDLGPVYNYQREGPPEIVGYRVIHSVTVTKQTNPEDIGKEAGEIIDTITKAGINDVSMVQFLLDEEKMNELKNIALENAVENAKEKAGTLAKASDVRLGEIVAVAENAQYSVAEPRFARIEMADAMMSTELVAGNYDVTASVMVKFRIV